jgi:hypothetical protein
MGRKGGGEDGEGRKGWDDSRRRPHRVRAARAGASRGLPLAPLPCKGLRRSLYASQGIDGCPAVAIEEEGGEGAPEDEEEDGESQGLVEAEEGRGGGRGQSEGAVRGGGERSDGYP